MVGLKESVSVEPLRVQPEMTGPVARSGEEGE
jgi:hypothetical protein